MPDLHIVTGAFGFSGRHIAERLLEQGQRVRTPSLRRGRAAFSPPQAVESQWAG